MASSPSSGCFICSAPLVYGTLEKRACGICGGFFESAVVCEKGHYVCDSCHTQTPLEVLSQWLRTEQGTDAVEMMTRLLAHPAFALHGPEHHYVLPAVLLKTLENQGQEVPPGYWNLILARCKDLPGGTCGYWGACSAALGAGIALSILTGANPLKAEAYDRVHAVNAAALSRIAQVGGPRCCKRNLFLSLEEALRFFERELKRPLFGKRFVCGYFNRNSECIGKRCPFYPKGKGSEHDSGTN